LGIHVKDPISIFVEGEKIILTKHKDACTVCGDTEAETVEVKGRPVCTACVTAIKRI
jgi:transcriptional pleiotropic regulator of transition state genes